MTQEASVGELALRLQQSETDGLCVATDGGAPSGNLPNGCRVEGKKLFFASLEVRNQLAADHLAETLGADPDPADVFRKARELWRREISASDKASGRFLKRFESLDLLALACLAIEAGSDVFDVLHLVQAALPYLETLAPESLVRLTRVQHEKTKSDLAGGVFFTRLEEWLQAHPELVEHLHDTALAQMDESTAGLVGNCLVALAHNSYSRALEIARLDTHNADVQVASGAAWAIGRMALVGTATEGERSETNSTLASLIEDEREEIRRQAIRTASMALPRVDTFDATLLRLCADGNVEALSGVARALFLDMEAMLKKGGVGVWLKQMSLIAPSQRGAINSLDAALSRLCERGDEQAASVVETLKAWVLMHGSVGAGNSTFGDCFPSTLNALRALPVSWSSLVTDWLLSDRKHAAALGQVLNLTGEGSNPQLDPERALSCSDPELLLLARRLLGFIHERSQLTSLALSLLAAPHAERRFPLAFTLLVEEIGYDYPTSTVDDCTSWRDASNAEDVREFLEKVIAAIEKRTRGLEDLPRLKEMRPPTMLARQFQVARRKQMSRQLEEAQKKSIMRMIATQIPIKAGRGTFSYRGGSYGQRSGMASISHSVEIPRRETLDPVGNAIRLLQFRIAERDE